MTHLNSQNPKPNSSKHNNKKRLTQDQVRLLEMSFSSNKKLEPERKLQLARELGIPPRQIAIWYQNKRARWRTQSLELDYSTLQIRLEAAVSQKRELEKEVARLQGELDKAHRVLLSSLKQPPPPPPLPQPPSSAVGSLSSCCDEDVSCSWMSSEGLQLEDLYACLMGAQWSRRA